MRPHAHDLEDPPDGALLDELAGEDRTLHVEALAVVDGVLSSRLFDHPFDFLQLRQGRQRRLVGEVVLAVLHNPGP